MKKGLPRRFLNLPTAAVMTLLRMNKFDFGE